MRSRFRARFQLPSLTGEDEWTVMWNCISNEEAAIADQVWNDLSMENQEILRNSQVIPELLKILVDSRDKKKWTRNPILPMLKYAHMMMLLQPPNWSMYFVMIQNWISEFRLHELDPKVTEQEILAQTNALTVQTEKDRKSWRAAH
jgi:hypothetical protein